MMKAVVSPDGKNCFHFYQTGDLELWTMDIDGKTLKQLTFGLGYYDGGAFSLMILKIVFRASRPKTDTEIKEYKDYLAQNLVAPTNGNLHHQC